VSDIVDLVGFECYQTQDGIWVKERPDGRRGHCVADEAVLWQALQAATEGKPQPTMDVKELVRENERLCHQVEGLNGENRGLYNLVDELKEENARLRANQRQKPGRKPRPRSDAAGASEEAGAAPEHEYDPLDEDL
jgi:hypothetical protein